MKQLWLYCMHVDSKLNALEKRCHEQEVEAQASRYMVEFYKAEITEIRRDKERISYALDESNKRRKIEDDERNALRKEILNKDLELEKLKSHLMNVVRERDAAQRDAQHFRTSLDQHHENRKGLRKSVRVLRDSLNGETTGEVAEALQQFQRYCQ